jgi:succinyl-CoA synthetase beta subunit
MKIHEYQAKTLFKRYAVPIPEGAVAFSPQEARQVAATLGGFPVIVKAQIHAGGRGKGGGVKLAHSLEEVEALTAEMIGMTLVTHQTGPEGQPVKKVLVEQGLDIAKELYLSIIPDRASAEIVIMVSEAGGMDIETVAEQTPEKIIKVHINPLIGIQSYHCLQVAHGLRLESALVKPFIQLLNNLYRLFLAHDASLVEINPLVVTKSNTVLALDAKMTFDDSAMFRQKEIADFRDVDEENPLEVEASGTISTISTWTAMWATWSTAPAWPWPPWTSSSLPVRGRPTFWMWAAEPTLKWWKTVSASFWATPMSKAC